MWSIAALVISLFISAIGVEKFASSKIVSRIEQELPKASGVRASIPLIDMPRNLTSNSIKSVNIEIKKYSLKGSNTDVSLKIAATNISKSKPTLIQTLNVTATIPASTILKSSGFSGAKIVDNALQVSVGSGGLGEALLVPKFSNNQLFFELKSVSLFGNEISASSLPADIQNQVKSKSIRNLTIPKGLEIKSVSLNSEGLSLKIHGNNIELGNLGRDF